jgi:hypothetical protein
MFHVVAPSHSCTLHGTREGKQAKDRSTLQPRDFHYQVVVLLYGLWYTAKSKRTTYTSSRTKLPNVRIFNQPEDYANHPPDIRRELDRMSDVSDDLTLYVNQIQIYPTHGSSKLPGTRYIRRLKNTANGYRISVNARTDIQRIVEVEKSGIPTGYPG